MHRVVASVRLSPFMAKRGSCNLESKFRALLTEELCDEACCLYIACMSKVSARPVNWPWCLANPAKSVSTISSSCEITRSASPKCSRPSIISIGMPGAVGRKHIFYVKFRSIGSSSEEPTPGLKAASKYSVVLPPIVCCSESRKRCGIPVDR